MRKIISGLIICALILLSIPQITFAALSPEYDASFNNNKGILYANGNDIVITKENDNTVAKWNGGSQVVPETVTIVGGGKEGTNIEKTNIVMEDGTVSLIYGGGKSLVETSIAKVGESNVIVNGGTILQTVYGGGLMYTTTNKANVVINDGKVAAICGGGAASAVISGVAYSAGTETDLKNSKNRVDIAKVTINGGTIEYTSSSAGLVFAGGQGYSYVGSANLEINDGDLSNAYVTAGGSNGYTGSGIITINGGDIYLVQSVNRGIVEKANVKIDGGTIEKVYIGGEVDLSVTGTVYKSDVNVLKGLVKNLYQGTSNGEEIPIGSYNYKALAVKGTVLNTIIPAEELEIKYKIYIYENDFKLIKGDSKIIDYEIRTEPYGNENIFSNEKIQWTTSDSNVIEIDENGRVTAKGVGKAQLSVKMLDSEDSIYVEVEKSPASVQYVYLIIISVIVLVFSIIVARKIYK